MYRSRCWRHKGSRGERDLGNGANAAAAAGSSAARRARDRESLARPNRMSQQDDDDDGAPHPRETMAFFGHSTAEAALLAAYRSGRMPHGILIAGPKGIGKATLAFRLARFVLSHPDPAATDVRDAVSL